MQVRQRSQITAQPPIKCRVSWLTDMCVPTSSSPAALIRHYASRGNHVYGGFACEFVRNTAQMEWSATVGGHTLVSDPIATSSSSFAEIGHERNGSISRRQASLSHQLRIRQGALDVCRWSTLSPAIPYRLVPTFTLIRRLRIGWRLSSTRFYDRFVLHLN
jgi:hypothetical protein